MLNSKVLRISIGLLFLLFLVVSFVPSFYMCNSSDGIINARTTTLRSPIEGILHFNSPTRCGKFFKKGELIGEVSNEQISRAHLNELVTERKTLESRVSSLGSRILEFNALNKRLEENIDKYQKYSLIQLQQQLKQTDDKLVQENAEQSRAKKEFDAGRQLVDRQAVKLRDFETAEAAYLKSSSRLKELENRSSELKNSLEAVQSGIFLGDGHNDVPYSSQRRDQLVIEICLAKTAMDEAKSRIEGIDQQIADEQKRLQQLSSYQIKAPFNALIWRMPAIETSSIVIDSELLVLLNCSSVFLDFVVSETQFSDIEAGSAIQYRLLGESQYHTGKVFALRGSGSDLNDHSIAAVLNKDAKRDFHVWVELDPSDLDFKAENFFQVGRRVQVKIPRKIQPLRSIIRFFNVF